MGLWGLDFHQLADQSDQEDEKYRLFSVLTVNIAELSWEQKKKKKNLFE